MEQADAMQIGAQAAVAVQDRMSGKINTLSSVSPVDFRAWRSHVLLTGQTHGWGNLRHRREALGAFRGAAYSRIWMVEIDMTDQCGPIEEALDAWQAKFITASGTQVARRQFENNSQQKTDESILDYHTRLMELFALAWPNVPLAAADTDERLMGKFIDGLADGQMATKLYDMDLGTYTLLRHHAERFEGGKLLPQNQRAAHRRGLHSVAAIEDSQSLDLSGLTKEQAAALRSQLNRFKNPGLGRNCWTCNSPLHIARNCPKATSNFAPKATFGGFPNPNVGRGGRGGQNSGGRGGGGHRGRGYGGRGRGRGGQNSPYQRVAAIDAEGNQWSQPDPQGYEDSHEQYDDNSQYAEN